MTRRWLLACLVATLWRPMPVAGQTFGPPVVQVPAWTPIASATRFPAAGTFDVSSFAYLGGVIGLNPNGPASVGVVTFYWSADAGATQPAGVQSFPLTSYIVSVNQIRIPNLGSHVYLTYQPLSGVNPLYASLFGTNASSPWPEVAGDTILIDYKNFSLAPYASAGWYPDDYFAGPVRLYLACGTNLVACPSGVTATVYGMDLVGVWWPIDTLSAVSMTTVTPMGTWLVVVSNAAGSAITYSISATPLLTGIQR